MLILSAIGHDRPGIVAGITRVLFEHGCNLQESSMTRLAGQFSCILMLTAPDHLDMQAVTSALEAEAAVLGLTVQLRPLQAVADAPARDLRDTPYIVSLYGADKPGLVYRVVSLLAQREVNITDVVTQRAQVPGGVALYQLMLEVELPRALDPDDLDRVLQQAAAELGVRLTLRPLESAEL
jgi:glycine cleavage system transcriptional repressor